MTVLDIIEQKQPIKHKLLKNVYAVGELDNTQKSVINAIEECNMVAVTGCFGTGKSHVITNLASHYLVNGKKVLIVAKNLILVFICSIISSFVAMFSSLSTALTPKGRAWGGIPCPVILYLFKHLFTDFNNFSCLF